jgi:elongator complex protein 3
LLSAQKENEKAPSRIVGLSIETRADLINAGEIRRLRRLGVTLVEMGVQTLDDRIHQQCQTGLNVAEIAGATKLLKEAGFKVLYQLMLNLPGSSPKKDLETFRIAFNDQRFKPDWLKIYPCLVCRNSRLYNWWLAKKYRPYPEKELKRVLMEIKANLPFWVRLARLFRDIPSSKIESGGVSNLREIVRQEMAKTGRRCRCIRCREVRDSYDPKEKALLFRQDYPASFGREIFLSVENRDRSKLHSFLRLRIPSSLNQSPIEVLSKAAIVRELQTYGPAVPFSGKNKTAQTANAQHRGLGKKLLKEAERISGREFGLAKIAVIAGPGVRGYYRRRGYRLKQTYMVKKLF